MNIKPGTKVKLKPNTLPIGSKTTNIFTITDCKCSENWSWNIVCLEYVFYNNKCCGHWHIPRKNIIELIELRQDWWK